MSTTFPLPLECLQLIIRAVARQSGVNTLASLLRVNRYVCSATLPILYEGPLLSLFLNGSFDEESNYMQRRLMLIDTLLLGVPKTHISDLLSAAFPQDSVDQGKLQHNTTPFALYHSFATSVSLHDCSQLYDGDFRIPRFMPPQSLVDFVNQNGLEDRYRAETPYTIFAETSSWGVLNIALTQELRKDLTWALCSNVEHIQSLAIPLSDIDRYFSVVERFKVLSNVTFEIDQYLHENLDDGFDPEDLTPQMQVTLSELLKERTRHLDTMLLFVQEHQRHHNGVLRTAGCPRVFPYKETCPPEYEAQLLRLLAPLANPKYLSTENWVQFATKVKETNLFAVKYITPPSPQPRHLSLARLLEQDNFLQRCRSLRRIHMPSLPEDVFQWAVDERTQHDAAIATDKSPSNPLVPLETVTVSAHYSSDGRQVNDIGFAFGDTLKHMHANSRDKFGLNLEDSPMLSDCAVGVNLSLSTCWNTPLLSVLYIQTTFNFLRIHPHLLSKCPQLTSILLEDPRKEYSASDIVPWKPAKLPHLESLHLRGTPAFSFHPSTLKNTPNLESLVLASPFSRHRHWYIPPVTELDVIADKFTQLLAEDDKSTPRPGRSVWSWDWNLPKLVKLVLNAEFAYRFKFKMLQGTPSLAELSVDITSISPEHKRKITSKDLIAVIQGETTKRDSDGIKTQFEYLQCPSLLNFSLLGPWTLDKQVLEIMCSHLAPSVTELSLEGCVGFSLIDWVRTTSKHLHELQSANASLRLSPKLLKRAGLVAASNGSTSASRFRLSQLPEGRTDGRFVDYIFW